MKKEAEIGVFGGTGLYSLFKEATEVKINTPYGATSDLITIGEVKGKIVAFLPRHGRHHHLPPHKIPYLANIWAMKELGVERIISPYAAGSLRREYRRGDFVLCSQFIDRTNGRKDTFFDGPCVTHVSTAFPFCPELQKIVINTARQLGITMHEDGVMVVIQGPRFSSVAESKWFQQMGCSVINMTGYPEVTLAREMEICFVAICLITDYDAGLEGMEIIEPVTSDEVVKIFNQNIENVKNLILEMIGNIPPNRSCSCADSLKNARV